MIPRRVNAAWLQPVSTDPGLFVNRESQRQDFLRRLEEHREAHLHEASFVVTGAPDLVKLDVLMPRHRYSPNLGLRIKTLLDLLRPSVRQKL